VRNDPLHIGFLSLPRYGFQEEEYRMPAWLRREGKWNLVCPFYHSMGVLAVDNWSISGQDSSFSRRIAWRILKLKERFPITSISMGLRRHMEVPQDREWEFFSPKLLKEPSLVDTIDKYNLEQIRSTWKRHSGT
jgi:hypothetical protein